MSSVNKVILIGNVGRDPEVRTVGGSKVVSLSIATTERWSDKTTGEKKESTQWHNIVIWNERIGEVVERYVTKGSKIFIEGQLQTRKWTDKEGRERYTTEVVLQRFRGELVMLGGNGDAKPKAEAKASSMDLDDEIPF